MCNHEPPCPSWHSPNRHSAKAIITNEKHGWSLLCNGLIVNEVREVEETPSPAADERPAGDGTATTAFSALYPAAG
jgi:hypothetical protein